MRTGSLFVLCIAWLFCAVVPSMGQQPSPNDHILLIPKPQQQAGRLSRWIDIKRAEVGIRNKLAAAYSDTPEPFRNQVQYGAAFLWDFKFDSKGKYALGFAATAGRGFKGSWSNTGIGPDPFVGKFYLRQLYISVRPLRGLELQFGGLGFVRGDWTSITDFAGNGYLTGERVRIRRPDKFFFDEISLTGGAAKDIDKPNVFSRLHRLKELNYYQFFATKKIGENISLSGGFDSFNGSNMLHQAVNIEFKKFHVADTLLFENYERLDNAPTWGFGLTIEKTLFSRWTLTAGASDVDGNFIPLNSEKLGRGDRFYVGVTHEILPGVSLFIFGTKAFRPSFPLSSDRRIELGFTYDVHAALSRAHLL